MDTYPVELPDRRRRRRHSPPEFDTSRRKAAIFGLPQKGEFNLDTAVDDDVLAGDSCGLYV